MSTVANQAAWFYEKAGPFKVGEAPMPTPAAYEIVIRSHAIAFNPADVAVWKMGLFVQEWPGIVGCDVAGVVTAVGDSVTRFQIGDRVLAAPNWTAKDRSNKGSGQLYCAAVDGLAAKLPDNISFTHGCVLPLGMCTAAASLFQKSNLALPYPQVDPKPAVNAKVLLVWGGSSSVGSCAIQMAKAAGLEVATTCSSHNFEYCKEIGADYVFDYASESVVDDVVNKIAGKESAGVFDAVVSAEIVTKSAEIAHQLGGRKHVATVMVGPPMPDQQVPEGLPEDVTTSYCWSTTIQDDEVGPAVFDRWITDALADGALKCKPDAEVVGQGLEAVQEAVERMEKGVSAKKLVVEIS